MLLKEIQAFCLIHEESGVLVSALAVESCHRLSPITGNNVVTILHFTDYTYALVYIPLM